jgi:CrcB protein
MDDSMRSHDHVVPSEAEAIADAELAHAPGNLPRSPGTPWRDHLSTIVAVSLGGLIGANARYLVGIWVGDHWGNAFPWGTLLINVTGSFVLGCFLTLVTERLEGSATTRLFVATGFLGAYTTFSTFAYETASYVRAGELLRALAYVGASLVCGLAAVVAGITAARIR